MPDPAARVDGLSEDEARKRLMDDGPNELPRSRRRSVLRLLRDIVAEPMFLLLVAASTIYLVFGNLREALVLLASIVVIMAITIYQSRKNERALEALRDLSSPRALVVRDGLQ